MPSNRHRHHQDRSRPESASRHARADLQARPERYAARTDKGLEIRPELVDSEAREEAERCCNVSYTQMRRFFGAAKAEEMGMTSANQARLAVALLKAKAYYAAAREEKNRPLADFFDHHANLIRTEEDFKNFMKHFEAVIAYHKFYDSPRSQKKARR